VSQPKVKWGYGSLVADKQGKLFLATNHGLLKFNYEQFSFDLIVPGRIRSVCQYDDDRLYMLSGDSVLWYDKKNNRTDGFRLPEQKFFSKIMNLKGELYVSQESSLYKLKIQERQLTPFINFRKSVNLVTDAVAYYGLYYYLTQWGGINVSDGAGAIKRHNPCSIAGNQSVLAKGLFLDQTGVIWVATQLGLFLYDPVKEEQGFLRLNLNDAYSLPNNSIWTIYPDPDQGVWIGTYGGKIA